MPLLKPLVDWNAEHTQWRRDLHAHPETAFQERYTSDFVAARLAEMGIAVHRGLAGTGVVGTLTRGAEAGSAEAKAGGSSQPVAEAAKLQTIALRADMDALDITEQTGLSYQSLTPGKMHACGHDGHTTMLLAAARYLARQGRFQGTVHFVFQPAEENEGGGRVMVEQGLFDRFPAEAVFGMHNWPGLPVGEFAVKAGPMMAAFDVFEIVIKGKGAHAALPHLGIDPVVIASQLVTALQTAVSREVDPIDSAVLTVTQIHAGDTWNVIPESAVLRGTVRTFSAATQDAMEATIHRRTAGVCAAFGAEGEVRYERRYPATINTAQESEWAAEAAEAVSGSDRVHREPSPCMGSEDFAFMLQQRPGSYIWAGNGPTAGQRTLHNPHYDFNDELIPVGASYWASLVERLLPG